MDVSDILDRETVFLRQVGSKPQALSAVADIAARRFGAPAPTVLAGLLARERQSSTGVGGGVALPHTAVAGLAKLRGVFIRLEAPVAFDAVDGRPVDLIFALFTPDDPAGEPAHLRALAKAARLLRDRELVQQLRQARTPDALYALLARETPQSSAA